MQIDAETVRWALTGISTVVVGLIVFYTGRVTKRADGHDDEITKLKLAAATKEEVSKLATSTREEVTKLGDKLDGIGREFRQDMNVVRTELGGKVDKVMGLMVDMAVKNAGKDK